MKTIALLFAALLMSLQVLVAQKQPVFPKLSGDQYYQEDTLLYFLKSGTEKSLQFAGKFFEDLVSQYSRIGKSLPTNDLDSIFEKYVEVQEIHLRARIDSNSLWNVETNTLENFLVTTDYDGPGHVYSDSVNGVYFAFTKGNCLNYVKVMPTIVGVGEKNPKTPPVVLDGFGLKPKPFDPIISGNPFGGSYPSQSISGSFNTKTTTITNNYYYHYYGKDSTAGTKSVDLNLPTTVEEQSTWFKRNKKWFIPLTTGLVTFGTGFVAHDKNHSWYIWFPKDDGPVGVETHNDDGGILGLFFSFGKNK